MFNFFHRWPRKKRHGLYMLKMKSWYKTWWTGSQISGKPCLVSNWLLSSSNLYPRCKEKHLYIMKIPASICLLLICITVSWCKCGLFVFLSPYYPHKFPFVVIMSLCKSCSNKECLFDFVQQNTNTPHNT